VRRTFETQSLINSIGAKHDSSPALFVSQTINYLIRVEGSGFDRSQSQYFSWLHQLLSQEHQFSSSGYFDLKKA
jgi:hypothetical protein